MVKKWNKYKLEKLYTVNIFLLPKAMWWLYATQHGCTDFVIYSVDKYFSLSSGKQANSISQPCIAQPISLLHGNRPLFELSVAGNSR